jgi:hypothetical protein
MGVVVFALPWPGFVLSSEAFFFETTVVSVVGGAFLLKDNRYFVKVYGALALVTQGGSDER